VDGKVSLRIEPDRAGDFTLNIRIPGWARGEVVPGDLYRFADPCPNRLCCWSTGKLCRRRWTRGSRDPAGLESGGRGAA